MTISLRAHLAPQAPAYRLTVGGAPIALGLERLLSLSLTDRRGLEADQLEVTLSDARGTLAIPRRGALLSLNLGWTGDLIERGTYTVTEITHAGPPDALTITALSADLRAGPLTRKRDQTYHRTTLGEVLQSIAARNALVAVIAPDLAAETIEHEEQDKESDAALLTRLAEAYDAIATVKAGRLLFAPMGRGTTASGQPLPPIALTRRDLIDHRYTLTERDAYTGVIAEYHDPAAAEVLEAVAGDEDNAKRLRRVYADQSAALTAARAELARIGRGLATLELSLAAGRADLCPETPIQIQGLPPEICAHRWICTEAVHRLDDSGYLTTCTAEAPSAS